MTTLENRQYGGGFKPCFNCKVMSKDLDDRGHCPKCRVQPACSLCLAEVPLEGGTCTDRAACAERYWRCTLKQADFERDAARRAEINKLNPVKYEHHNESCDYIAGRWVCSASCAITHGVQ